MSQLETLLACLSGGGILRMTELLRAGVTAASVQRALAAGLVERVSRGTDRQAGAPDCAGADFAEILVRVPRGVICLHSAAAAHGLGDETPTRAWVAVPHGVAAAKLEWPPTRFVHWRDPAAFVVGVDTSVVCGVEVRMTSPARTVVDMLRMSSTVGDDRALECLRDYHASGRSAAVLVEVASALGIKRRLADVLRVSSAMVRAS